ncbi:MAG TPA: cytochrome c biogenesis protein CcdA [Nitrososphaera sp.]|nr:MAG: cytochrome C biogenesis protein [Nitrososphaerota archaeon]TLY08694.1 MAG: cytochrome C biogenesis protein [Nitrososphaerota archaeon]HEU0048987.1 cytochrome c biogenesis protein CcdA [Nitrososphaera sp.]
MVETGVLVSALAGVGSFFSPCILPIIPAFVSYLSGTTLSEIQSQNQGTGGTSVAVKKSTRLNIFLNTVYFVLGFSLVFAVLGVILNSLLINVGTSFQATFQTIGGSVIIAFGAYLILSSKIRVLNFERRMTHIPRFKTTYLTSFMFGAAFASGWTPCVGPILGTTLTLAATSPGAAYNSLLAYSLGLGVPFLITGAFFSQSTKVIKKMIKHLKYFNPIMGAILIILGILVLTNQLSMIGNFPLANEIINLERGFT